MAELFPGEAQFAENAAKTFAALDYTGELGSLPPELAFAGIGRMARNVPAASKYLRGLDGADDPWSALTQTYMDARIKTAVDRAVAADARDRRRRDIERANYYATKTGMTPEAVMDILNDESATREAVEARAALYRL